MLKNRFMIGLFVITLIVCSTGTAFTSPQGPLPVAPTLTLTVTKSPLAIYPPVIIHTAKLGILPTMSPVQYKVDFYSLASTGWVLLGSATMDRTGKAVLSKQMKAGTYTVMAQVVIGGKVITSNKVTYKVT
jgi:hypothetical protein